MSKKYFALLGLGIFLILSSQIIAQTLKLPYKDVGACPFECCTYRQWTAKKNLILYKNMSESSPIAFRVTKGEKVTGMTGVVITTVAGKAEILKNQTLESSKVQVKKGDTLFLLTYLGEGWFRIWYQGKFFEDDGYANGIKILSMPKAVWWVKIKNRKGQIGWTKSSDEFNNQDQCG
jgi:hypothetical protein